MQLPEFIAALDEQPGQTVHVTFGAGPREGVVTGRLCPLEEEEDGADVVVVRTKPYNCLHRPFYRVPLQAVTKIERA